jgi:uncharacterized protein
MSLAATPDELRRIIRRIEEKHRRLHPARRPAALEEVVGGEVEETERGPVYMVRRRFPVEHRQGTQPLGAARAMPPEALALLARSAEPPRASGQLLYLDTETTGLAGGTGTYAFLIGAGYFEGDAFEVRQYFMRDLDEEPALIEALEVLLGRFDGVVTYNGTGFDLPLLETRFVLARRRWRNEAAHLDLLRPTRRLWSTRLPDCRLGTVEHHVLSFERDHNLPGALIPAVYFDYLRRKDPAQLPRVFDHNRHDILSLVALAGWVGRRVAQAPGADVHPEELVGLGHLWEHADRDRSAACYRMAIEAGLASPARERVLLRLAREEKRQARWVEARALWEAAARSGGAFDAAPWIEMAKIDEHRRRDLGTARAVVEEALAFAELHRASERVLAGLGYRLARVSRRLAAGSR